MLLQDIINKLSNGKDEWIFYLKSMGELSLVMKDFKHHIFGVAPIQFGA